MSANVSKEPFLVGSFLVIFLQIKKLCLFKLKIQFHYLSGDP